MQTSRKLTAAVLVAATSPAFAGFLESVADTLPGGIATSSDGFFSAQLSGTRYIMDEGRDGIAFGIYTEHPAWDYDNRNEENGLPVGGGWYRTVIDGNGNELSLLLMTFSDSHYYPEPTIGYSWISRRKVGGPFHVGAGYLLGLTFRDDYHWLPIPLPLPVVKVGTDRVGVNMTFIPFTNVFFFYGTVSTDSKESRSYPLASDSPFADKTEIYGAWMWERTDSATENGFTITSDKGILGGIRHFFAPNWAIDFNYATSEHDTHNKGVRDRRFKHETYSVTVQYHVNMTHTVRMHAGLGMGYGSLENKDNSSDKGDALFPTVQLGATWAPVDHLRVLGGINLQFPRYGDIGPDNDVTFRPSPVQMYVGAGIAF